MATYTNDIGSKSQLVFDKNLHLLQAQNISGSLATLFANKKPKPLPPSKGGERKASIHNDKAQATYPNTPGPSPLPVQFKALPSQHFVAKFSPMDSVPQGSYRSDANEWRIQWGEFGGNPQTINEPMDDELSDQMDLSSGPEADEECCGLARNEMADYAFSKVSKLSNLVPEEQHETQDLSDHMELSSGPEASDDDEVEEEEEAPSVTQRTSNTPSKASGPSSHTSVGVNDEVQKSIEDIGASFGVLKPPSRSSSLSSQLSPAKSTTPAGLKPAMLTPKAKPRRRQPKETKIHFQDHRPRTTIPVNLPPAVLAQQGIHAAYSSRLNPFALHPDEYRLLRDHICHLHVTAYLNIRNRILRLWVRNPLVSVTAEEAAGCALASRWLGLAEVAYEWLIRKGYINFGCVEIPETTNAKDRRYKLKRLKKKTIVVVGAGMSGLGCARQLDGLFRHYRDRWTSAGDEPPNVVLLEGRNRVGGRVYSHPLKDQRSQGIPAQNRCTAEMGAHIIVGFDHGNPLNMIVRGQLAIPYYALKNDSIIHDTDGNLVDPGRDDMVEKLYNDVLDRASVYRHPIPIQMTSEGDKDLIEAGRDPQREGGPFISVVEADKPIQAADHDIGETEIVPAGIDRLTGKAHMISGSRKKDPPALAAETMGWRIASNVLAYQDLNLDVVAKATKNPTLGAAMDEAVKQYQFLLDLSPGDMRLLNWHYANLEYANAANVGKLSLGGWDQDTGNEFEGVHAQVIGGYQQVPRGILHSPSKLDLRTRKVVKQITYNMYSGSANAVAKVLCEDGEVFDADHVILTSPLGVLKDETIAFDPPLPDWKKGPIQRLGFGTLNKVILVYDKPFWPVNQDMFGLLREPEVADSLDQEDYIANRGKFYFFWNCIKTSGRPVLISLMAGDAAHQAESTSDAALVTEVTRELAKIFKQTVVPSPVETIVTRWGKDRFARGSYSYVGANSVPGDYESMAAPYGNLHFAGEATCATHPATVHGAYISGLRAASEVIDDLLGPIEVPNPLVPWPKTEGRMSGTPQKRKADNGNSNTPKRSEEEEIRTVRLEAFESDILQAIYTELGLRPSPPQNTRPNAFLLYTSEKWAECKRICEEERRAATGNPDGKASKNEVRASLGHAWNHLSRDDKLPYNEQAQRNKIANLESAATFDGRLAAWDAQAMEVRRRYVEAHPGVMTQHEEEQMWAALRREYGDAGGEERRAKKMSGYAEVSDDE